MTALPSSAAGGPLPREEPDLFLGSGGVMSWRIVSNTESSSCHLKRSISAPNLELTARSIHAKEEDHSEPSPKAAAD